MSVKNKRDRLANLEKEQILNPEKIKENKKKKTKKICFSIFTVLFILVASVSFSFMVVRAVGKSNLKKAVESERPEIQEIKPEVITEEEQVIWKDGWVKHNDKVYEYNEDIITFLFMGIDKNSVVKEVAEGTNGGQADALFLAVMNPHDESIKIIGINRNTMTDVDVYNDTGAYVTTKTAQIATQHGFGNGVEESCRYQVNAVKKLMYNLPIHGYAAINMSAIPTINDAVGGVDVVALEDVKGISKGDKVHLEGRDAFDYVKFRDTSIYGSADGRLERQKQYLAAFVGKAKETAKKNVGVVLEIYDAIKSQMVTDISADEVSYLAPELIKYNFSGDALISIQGENVMGDKFEEFYVDSDALYELILEVFYEEIVL